MRPLAIRRTGRRAPPPTQRWAIVDSRPGSERDRLGRGGGCRGAARGAARRVDRHAVDRARLRGLHPRPARPLLRGARPPGRRPRSPPRAPTRPGSARTSAATGSPAPWSCSRTGSTTATPTTATRCASPTRSTPAGSCPIATAGRSSLTPPGAGRPALRARGVRRRPHRRRTRRSTRRRPTTDGACASASTAPALRRRRSWSSSQEEASQPLLSTCAATRFVQVRQYALRGIA